MTRANALHDVVAHMIVTVMLVMKKAAPSEAAVVSVVGIGAGGLQATVGRTSASARKLSRVVLKKPRDKPRRLSVMTALCLLHAYTLRPMRKKFSHSSSRQRLEKSVTFASFETTAANRKGKYHFYCRNAAAIGMNVILCFSDFVWCALLCSRRVWLSLPNLI